MKINNKIKQFFGRNWSSNKFTKKHTNIPTPIFEEETKHKSDKKYKKKEKKKWVFPGDCCTFCNKELVKKKTEAKYSFLSNREKRCRNCGAKKGKLCPACKMETWYLNGIYKHSMVGCGFIGKKLKRK